MKIIRNVGFDFGFGFIKGKLRNEDNLSATENKVVFPTLFKGYRGKKIQQETPDEYIVKINGEKTYAVGDFATIGDIVKIWDKEQSLSKEQLTVFLGTTLFVLSSQANDNADNEVEYVNLSVGLPIDYFRHQKDELEKILDNLNLTVEINGITKNFIIERTIISQQGVGAFMALIFDVYGKLREGIDKDLIAYGGGLADIGYGTFDGIRIVVINKKFVISDEESFSVEDNAIRKANEKACTVINNELGQNFNVLFYEKALKENNGFIKLGKNKFDIKPYFESEYTTLSFELENILKSKWTNLNTFGALYLTGGGAIPLIKNFNLDTDVKLQEKPSFANVDGYLAKLSLVLEKEKNY